MKRHIIIRSFAAFAFVVASAPMGLLTTMGTIGLLAPQQALAQDATSGEFFGHVIDSAGNPVAGIRVELTEAAIGFHGRSTTGSDGLFRFARLSNGTYVASVTTADGQRLERTIRVSAGTVQTIEFTIASGSASNIEEITVTASRMANSTSKDYYGQETGINIDIDQLLSRIPVARNITDAALLAPGTTRGDSAFSNSGGIGSLASFSGSSVAENVIQINGYNATDPRRFLGLMNSIPFEFFQQIDVKTGGFQAEYGRATGGITSLVTRSGTNEFHVGASVDYIPDNMRKHAPSTTDIFRRKDETTDTETNVWAGGPLIQDRLFFYGLVSFRDQSFKNFGNSTVSDVKDEDPFWGINVDGVLLDSLTLGRHSFTYTHIDDKHETVNVNSNFDRDTDTIGSVRGTITQHLGGTTDIVKYTGVINDALTVSGLWGHSDARVDLGSDADGNPVIIDFRSGSRQDLGSWANFTVNPDNSDQRELYRLDADIFVDNFFGSHKFRIGFEHEDLDSTESSFNSGGVYYAYFVGIPDRFDPAGTFANSDVVRVRDRTTGGSFNTEHDAIYFEDRWTLTDRITLNLGVRTEDSTNGAIDGSPFVKLDNQDDFRLGVTYDPTGNGDSRIFGFVGRTHLGVANNSNVRLAGSEIFTHDWFLLDGLNADDTPQIGQFFGRDVVSPAGVQDPRTLVSQTLKGQKQDEFILGYEKDIGDWTFGVKGIFRDLKSGIEDGAMDRGMLNFAADNGLDVDAMAESFGGFNQFILFNPGKDVDFFTSADNLAPDALAFLGGDPDGDGLVEVHLTGAQVGVPKVRRKHKALELTAEHQYKDGWSLQGSYVWTSLRGNYEGGVKSDLGQTDTGLTQDFDTAGLTDGTAGPGPNAHTHTFKAFGAYDINERITVGANFTVQSKRSFGCLGVHPTDGIASQFGASSFYCDLNGDGVKELTPRGSVMKSDWTKQLDLTLSIRPEFELPGEASLTFRVDIFNVFDSDDVTDRNEFGEFGSGQVRPTFGDPTGFLRPRSFRFSARVEF